MSYEDYHLSMQDVTAHKMWAGNHWGFVGTPTTPRYAWLIVPTIVEYVYVAYVAPTAPNVATTITIEFSADPEAADADWVPHGTFVVPTTAAFEDMYRVAHLERIIPSNRWMRMRNIAQVAASGSVNCSPVYKHPSRVQWERAS